MNDAWAVVLAAAVGAVSATLANVVAWFARRVDRRDDQSEERRQFLRENLLELVEAARVRATVVGEYAIASTMGIGQAVKGITDDLVGETHRRAQTELRVRWAKIAVTVADAVIDPYLADVKEADEVLEQATLEVVNSVVAGQLPQDGARSLIDAARALESALDRLIDAAKDRLADSS